MRLVLDTAAIVAAFRSPGGASNLLLEWAIERRYTALASVSLFLEYEAVVTRPEHLRVAKLSAVRARKILDALGDAIESVHVDFAWRPAAPDADDDMVVEAAANGRADAIVTFNVRDLEDAASRFGVPVVTPSRAVQLLRAAL